MDFYEGQEVYAKVAEQLKDLDIAVLGEAWCVKSILFRLLTHLILLSLYCMKFNYMPLPLLK